MGSGGRRKSDGRNGFPRVAEPDFQKRREGISRTPLGYSGNPSGVFGEPCRGIPGTLAGYLRAAKVPGFVPRVLPGLSGVCRFPVRRRLQVPARQHQILPGLSGGRFAATRFLAFVEGDVACPRLR